MYTCAAVVARSWLALAAPCLRRAFARASLQIARYLAGALLVEPRPFLGLTPLNLVTFACPHLGPSLLRSDADAADADAADTTDAAAAADVADAASRAAAAAAAGGSPAFSLFFLRHLAGRSGAQMALHDPPQLLMLMAHPRSTFYKVCAVSDVQCVREC